MSTFEIAKDMYEDCIKPYLEDITQMRESGMSVNQICDKLSEIAKVKIPEVVFLRLMSIHEDLYKAWYKGSCSLTLNVEDSLINSALGYNYEESETYYEFVNGEYVPTNKKVSRKYSKPDLKVLYDILKVLHPGRYRDNKEVENNIEIIMTDEVDDYSK